MKINKERAVSTLIIAVVLLAMLTLTGCQRATQATGYNFNCGTPLVKQALTQSLAEDGLQVTKYHQGYMMELAKPNQYHYVPEGAQVCWIAAQASLTNSEGKPVHWGFTYATWSVDQVQLIELKSL